MPKAPKKRSRIRIPYRGKGESSTARGYDWQWTKQAAAYRKEHPLCVPCLFANRVQPAQCVDHIIPHRKREELLRDEHNLCSMCIGCNTFKETIERELGHWNPQPARIIICGLPGTGKGTMARELSQGDPLWDWDEECRLRGLPGGTELGDHDRERILEARRQWIKDHGKAERLIMIVAHPYGALRMAAQLRGMVMHCACDESVRHQRLRLRGMG